MAITYYSFLQQKKVLEESVKKLNDALQIAGENNKKVLLLLSGGSSLALLNGIDTNNLGEHITISPLDERYSTNPVENNMAQIANTDFYKNAKEKRCSFIDTRVKEETQDELAKRLNDALNNWIANNPAGTIIATIGIGPDGHISGIMPYPESPEKFSKMFDNKKGKDLIIGYDAKEKNPYPKRVTTTMNMLRKIQTAIVYIVGDNKIQALNALKAEEGDLSKTPARILREIKADVFVFTDQNGQKNIGS